MPNKKLLSEIVDESAVKKQVDFLISELGRAKKVIQEFPQIYADFKSGNQAFSQMQAEIDKLKAKQKEMIQMSSQLDTANKKRIQLESDLALTIAKANIQNQEKSKAIKEEAREALGLNDAYKKLTIEYNNAAKAAKNLSVAHGSNSTEAKKAANEALNLSNRLKEIDKSVGQNQRNVGNYASDIKSALGEISPVANGAINKVAGIGGALTKLGPIGAAIGVGILAIGAPLMAFYKSTQEGVDRLTVKAAGFKGAMSVLTGKTAELGKSIDSIFGKDEQDKVSHFWEDVLGAQLGAKMDKASNTAKKAAQMRIDLEKEEIGLITQRAGANERLANARLKASDENNTIQMKIDLYKKAFTIENEVAKLEIDSGVKNENIIRKQKALLEPLGLWKRANEKEFQEAIAHTIELQTESDRRMTRGARQLVTFEKELRKEELDYNVSLLKDEETKHNDKNAKILANDHSTLQQKITAERSSLAETLKVMNAERDAKLVEPGMDETKRNTIIQENETAKFKLISDSHEKIRKMNEDYAKRDVIATDEIEKSKLEIQKDAIIEEIKIDQQLYETKLTYEQRIALLQKITNIDMQEENANYEKLIKNSAGKTKLELEAIEEEHNRKMALITTKGELDQISIHKEFYQKSIKNIERGETKAENIQEGSYVQQLGGFYTGLQSGKMSSKSFTQQKQQLTNTSEISSIDVQLAATKQMKEAAIREGDVDAADKYEKHILDLTKQRIDKQIELELKKAEKVKQIEDKSAELLKKSIDFAFTQQKNQLEKEKIALTQRLMMIETQKNADITRIEGSTLSEQQKAIEIKRIDSQALLEKQKIDAEERKMKQKQAKIDKEMAIFNAIINTAVAVTSALGAGPPLGIVLAVITAAMGALEIATIASKPIPTYALGTNSARGGLSITDEKGPELYIRPSGKMFMGNVGPTLRYLESGTKVIPSDRIDSYLMQTSFNNSLHSPSSRDGEIDKRLDKLTNTMIWQTNELKKSYKAGKKNVIVNNRIDLGYQNYINQQVKQ